MNSRGKEDIELVRNLSLFATEQNRIETALKTKEIEKSRTEEPV